MMHGKPGKRASLRFALGVSYFRLRRFGQWISSRKKFAWERKNELLGVSAFEHQSVLMRRLKDVDMWLQENKVKNLSIAAKKLDGLILKPGQTFSYWRCIGRPSKAKGYVKGMVLSNGGFYTGTGGGLCQLSNLIYWMTLHTPLTVTERHRHGYDVFPDSDRTLPFGSGATCFYNYIDLQIKNETNDNWQLHVYLDGEFLRGQWHTDREPDYRYEVYEKNPIITHEYPDGYMRHNEIFRRVLDRDGSMIADEYITENHAYMMYEPLLPGSGGQPQAADKLLRQQGRSDDF